MIVVRPDGSRPSTWGSNMQGYRTDPKTDTWNSIPTPTLPYSEITVAFSKKQRGQWTYMDTTLPKVRPQGKLSQAFSLTTTQKMALVLY